MFYLVGRYHGRGAVMAFSKMNGRLRFYSRMEKMTWIRAWTPLASSRYMYACGDFDTTDSIGTYQEQALSSASQYTAAVFRMDNRGNIIWYSVLTGSNPAVSTQSAVTLQS